MPRGAEVKFGFADGNAAPAYAYQLFSGRSCPMTNVTGREGSPSANSAEDWSKLPSCHTGSRAEAFGGREIANKTRMKMMVSRVSIKVRESPTSSPAAYRK